MRLNYLRISAFRGINEIIKLEPHGNSLLLIGDNGMGKPSILQAIEWDLLGELAFLEGDEFRREDALVNPLDKEGIAVVDMGIQDEEGETLQVVRERKRCLKQEAGHRSPKVGGLDRSE